MSFDRNASAGTDGYKTTNCGRFIISEEHAASTD